MSRAREALLRWATAGGAAPELRIVGVDDGPFSRQSEGDVLVVGAIYRGGEYLDGMVTTRVRRDGRNATDRLIEMIGGSRYAPQLHAVMLDGIALGGFNVVDINRLAGALELPVLVVIRRRPDMDSVRRAVTQLPGGDRKWRLIESAGAVEQIGELFVQRAGLDRTEAEMLLRLACTRSKLPEPLRAAHIIAGAVVTGEGGRRP